MTQLEKITKLCFLIVILGLTSPQTAFANDKLIQIVNSQTRQIKELSRKIDNLEGNVSSLKSEISQLKSAAKANHPQNTMSKTAAMSNADASSTPSIESDARDINTVAEPEISSSVPQVASQKLITPVPMVLEETAEQKTKAEARKVSDENTEMLGGKRDVKMPKTFVNEVGVVGVVEKNSLEPEGSKVEIAEDKKVYDQALILMKDGKFKEAEQKFSDFIRDYPDSNLGDKASFWYAESFYRQGIYNKAATEYLNSYKAYPKGTKAPDALLKLAYSLNALNKKQEACSMLAKLEKEFPNRSNNLVIRSEDAKARMQCGKRDDK